MNQNTAHPEKEYKELKDLMELIPRSWRDKKLKDITSRHQDIEYVHTLQLTTWHLPDVRFPGKVKHKAIEDGHDSGSHSEAMVSLETQSSQVLSQ